MKKPKKRKKGRKRPRKYQPTEIPKPTTSRDLFDKDMTLAEVVEICEQDPGCGFRLKGSVPRDFYFVDSSWAQESEISRGNYGPMMASGYAGWAPTIGFWDAALTLWRLIDLTKDKELVKQFRREYVGQTVDTRTRLYPLLRKELEEQYG